MLLATAFASAFLTHAQHRGFGDSCPFPEESVLGNDCLYGELREGWLCSRADKSPGLLSFIPVNKLFSACSLARRALGHHWGNREQTQSWPLGSFRSGAKDLVGEEEIAWLNVFRLRAAGNRVMVKAYIHKRTCLIVEL